jgi:hypothetical protein
LTESIFGSEAATFSFSGWSFLERRGRRWKFLNKGGNMDLSGKLSPLPWSNVGVNAQGCPLGKRVEERGAGLMDIEAGRKETSGYHDLIREILPGRAKAEAFGRKSRVGKRIEGMGRRETAIFFSLKSSNMTKTMHQGLEICFEENIQVWGASFNAKDETCSRTLYLLHFFKLSGWQTGEPNRGTIFQAAADMRNVGHSKVSLGGSP